MSSTVDLHDGPPPERNEEAATASFLLESLLPDLHPIPQSPRPPSSGFSPLMPRPNQLPRRRPPHKLTPETYLPDLASPLITSLPRSRIPRPRPGPNGRRGRQVLPLYKQVLRKEGWRVVRVRQAEDKERQMAAGRSREDDDRAEEEEELRILERRVRLLKEKMQVKEPRPADLRDLNKQHCYAVNEEVNLNEQTSQSSANIHTLAGNRHKESRDQADFVDVPTMTSRNRERSVSADPCLPMRRPRANSMIEQDLLDESMDADDEYVSDESEADDTDTEIDFEDTYQSMLLDGKKDYHHLDPESNRDRNEPLFPAPPRIDGPSLNEFQLSGDVLLSGTSQTACAAVDDLPDYRYSSDSEDSANSTLAPSSSSPIVLSFANIVKTAKERAHERQQKLIKKRGRDAFEQHLADDEARKKRRTIMVKTDEIHIEGVKKDQDTILREQRSKHAFWTAVIRAGRVKRGEEEVDGLGITSSQCND